MGDDKDAAPSDFPIVKEKKPDWAAGQPPTPALERALLFWLVIHVVAMLATALLILPGAPGGLHDGAGRVAYLAQFPWRRSAGHGALRVPASGGAGSRGIPSPSGRFFSSSALLPFFPHRPARSRR